MLPLANPMARLMNRGLGRGACTTRARAGGVWARGRVGSYKGRLHDTRASGRVVHAGEDGLIQVRCLNSQGKGGDTFGQCRVQSWRAVVEDQQRRVAALADQL